MLALFIGSVAGYINIIGREFSLSRTIVFFPYFWLGAICDSRVNWKKFRTAGLVALLIGIMIVYFIGDKLQVTFLYHADPYSNMENGSYLRLLCYFIGFLLGFFLLTWTLDKRFPFTKAGANTMPAYIAHGSLCNIAAGTEFIVADLFNRNNHFFMDGLQSITVIWNYIWYGSFRREE